MGEPIAESPHQQVVTFACKSCASSLTVPVAMADVEGLCPCCGEMISGPGGRRQANDNPVWKPIGAELPAPRTEVPKARTEDFNFYARNYIPPSDEPKDDSWKDVEKKERRRSKSWKRSRERFHKFVTSPWFRVGRGVFAFFAVATMVLTIKWMHSQEWGAVGDRERMVEDGESESFLRKFFTRKKSSDSFIEFRQ